VDGRCGKETRVASRGKERKEMFLSRARLLRVRQREIVGRVSFMSNLSNIHAHVLFMILFLPMPESAYDTP